MTTWRDAALTHFEQPTVHLTLVADPDSLLQEEYLLAVLRGRSFDILTFDDPVAFRYVYESRYRSHWDAGEETLQALVVRTDEPTVHHLPYDLLQHGRHLTLSLHDFLPKLSYPVVRDFFRTAPLLFDRLVDVSREHDGPRLGERQTLTFIAKHVYNLDPQHIATLDELVERLLHVHYHGWPLPDRLQPWLAQQLQRKPAFGELPVDQWLANRSAFFVFLENQWRAHLRSQGHTLADARPAYAPETPAVDFTRPGIRVLADTLFLEHKLQPVRIIAERPPADWTAVGVSIDTDTYYHQRLGQLLDHIQQHLPGPNANHRAWLEIASSWAEALVLAHRTSSLPDALQERFNTGWQHLIVDFIDWMPARYDALHSLPYLPEPVVGHQVVHFLARRLHGDVARLALIVVDGLALDQWHIIRTAWRSQGHPLYFDEAALFTTLPTVTPIARQALFAGQLPLYFPDTWQRTDVDARRWQHFWEDEGLFPSAIAWLLGSQELDAVLTDDRVRVLGLVITTVDKMLHGTVEGLSELHTRVRQWAEQGTLVGVVKRLLDAGFDVWLTSDHGNVAAEGIGRPREGVLVEQRGTRVRFYNDPAFRDRAREDVPEALAWTPAGLPQGMLTLFAPARQAFANRGERLITHGGLTLEEVIVPWIHITNQVAGTSSSGFPG